VAEATWNPQSEKFEVDWKGFNWTKYLILSVPYSAGLVLTFILVALPRRWRAWDLFLIIAILSQAIVLSVTFVFPRVCIPIQFAMYCLVARGGWVDPDTAKCGVVGTVRGLFGRMRQ
jgi:cytochrome bd-type quinol oxidase subunit 2